MQNGKTISIIIPNYNGEEELRQVYKSIDNQSYKGYNVILVDNGSTDSSVTFTENNYPEYKIIRLEKNYGFAKAVNEGLRFAISEIKPEFILLLNNDIELTDTFLQDGINTFEKVKEASFIAVKMLNYFNRGMIDDAGDVIMGFGGSPYARGHGEKDEGQYDKPEFIFGACAGAAFYKTKLFEECGVFDEDFFAYYEDIDLSFRFQLAGCKCYYNPEIVCYHKRGETVKQFKGWQTYYAEKNLISLRIKNYPLTLYLKYFPFFTLVRIKRFIIFILRHPSDVIISALKGYFKGLSEIPKAVSKRRNIQRNRKVSSGYISETFYKR